MIKETIDAVRLAELEADKIVSTALDNAQDKKNQIKTEALECKKKTLLKAEQDNKQKMEEAIVKCREYEKKVDDEIEKKVLDLKKSAVGKTEKAVNAVINALI